MVERNERCLQIVSKMAFVPNVSVLLKHISFFARSGSYGYSYCMELVQDKQSGQECLLT